MAFCNMCGAQIADGATVCAACSGRGGTVPVVVNTGSGLADNVAGMLAYVTIIPAIIFSSWNLTAGIGSCGSTHGSAYFSTLAGGFSGLGCASWLTSHCSVSSPY